MFAVDSVSSHVDLISHAEHRVEGFSLSVVGWFPPCARDSAPDPLTPTRVECLENECKYL